MITEDQIILSGGCNTHIVAYLEENNEITVGDVRSTKKLCANDEDGLYKRGLEKLNKYEVSIDGSEIVAVISD